MGSPRTLSPGAPPEVRRAPTQPEPGERPADRVGSVPVPVLLAAVLGAAAVLRVWRLNELGFNSDEAVYAGQGAAIANEPGLVDFFPVFRAHPLLFQTLLSLGYRLGLADGFERLSVAVIGVATVALVYVLGRLVYGRPAGLIAALVMALMPYHVVVTRQVLLDGPMVLFATLSLLLLVRFVISGRAAWLYVTGVAMGLTVLSKETSIVLLGAIYAFLALTPELRVRLRDVAISVALMALVIAPFPLTRMLGGQRGGGESYLAWELFRRPNHDWLFYFSTLPKALGPLVLVAAVAGLWLLRRQGTWRETLLLSWIVVPVVFFELWPVKGYQYLLPIAPAVAVLAGRALSRLPALSGDGDRVRRAERVLRALAVGLVAASLMVPSWERITGGAPDGFLAGSGGLPAGREAGEWIAGHVPAGATFMTVGPSMANLVQYYGHRKAYGLSVSPNPLNRNPSYEPLLNPDRAIRDDELQYLVWDAFSAGRSPHFADQLRRYALRYNGRVVHTERLPASTVGGKTVQRPAIVVFEVRR